MTKTDGKRTKTLLPDREDGSGNPNQVNKSKLPIDRGWAWVVVTAVFFMNLIHVGMYRCYGILFVEFLKEFKASKSVTSLVVGIYSASYSLTSLFVLNILIQKFSLRVICVTGGIMMSIGGTLSYFAMNLEFLIFTQSFLLGSGSALLYGPGIVIVGQYFEKRRALGQAISSCGVSLGGMVVPQLMRYLLSEYGLRGTLLISGGILSETVIFALLCRPPPKRLAEEVEHDRHEHPALEAFNKQIEYDISIESLNESISHTDHGNTENMEEICRSNGNLEETVVNCHPPPNISVAQMIMQRREPFRSRAGSDPTSHLRKPAFLHSFSVPKDSFLSSDSIDETGNSNSDDDITVHKNTGNAQSHLSPKSQRNNTSNRYLGSVIDTLSQSSYLNYASNADIHMTSTFSLNSPSVYMVEETKYPENARSCCYKIKKLLDFSVFKLPHFYIIVAQNMCSVCAISLLAAFLPASAGEMGLSDVQIALLLTVYAGVDFVSRFVSGVIVNTGRIRSHYLLAICLTGIGILYNFTRFYTSFTLLIMFSALFGLFSGCVPSMGPVVMIDFLGNDNLPKALGFVFVFHGIILSGVTPLIGALRDITGDYNASFHLLGAFGIMGGAVLLLEPLARKHRDSKKDRRYTEEVKPLNGFSAKKNSK